jgi:hypothetical protein
MNIFKWFKPAPWTEEQTKKLMGFTKIVAQAEVVGIARPEIEQLTDKWIEANPEMIPYRTSIHRLINEAYDNAEKNGQLGPPDAYGILGRAIREKIREVL